MLAKHPSNHTLPELPETAESFRQQNYCYGNIDSLCKISYFEYSEQSLSPYLQGRELQSIIISFSPTDLCHFLAYLLLQKSALETHINRSVHQSVNVKLETTNSNRSQPKTSTRTQPTIVQSKSTTLQSQSSH